MQLLAILEFKVADRFFYNSSKNPADYVHIPIFDDPEPIEKIDAFIKLLELKYPGHLHYEVNQIRKYWISFNQGWEIGRFFSMA